jgi:TolB-like protein
MKKPLAILLLLFSFASAQETIAVIEFEAKGISQIEASALSDELEINLTNIGGYQVVERGQMENILQEQGLNQTGCISSECAVEVGKLLSVQKIVLGSISKVGSTFSVNAKIVDVESGEIIKSANYKHKGLIDDLLTEGMAEVVAQLTGKELQRTPVTMTQQFETPRSVAPSTGKVLFNIIDGSALVGKINLSNATVWIANFQLEGNNKEAELPSGSYVYVAQKSGYKKREGTVRVVSGKTQQVDVYLYPENSVSSTKSTSESVNTNSRNAWGFTTDNFKKRLVVGCLMWIVAIYVMNSQAPLF